MRLTNYKISKSTVIAFIFLNSKVLLTSHLCSTSFVMVISVHAPTTIVTVIHKTSYFPLWDVTIAGSPPCPLPSVVPSFQYNLSEKAIRKHPKWWSRTSNHESDDRLWIGSPIPYSSFLVTIHLFCLVLEIFTCDEWTVNTTKQAVPVECLDCWLFPLIHSLGQLPHFCLGHSANPEMPKMAEPYFQSRIWWHILNLETQFPIRIS